MNNKILIVIAAVILLGGAFFLLNKPSTTPAPSETTSEKQTVDTTVNKEETNEKSVPTAEPTKTETDKMAVEAETFTIDASNFKFSTKEIKVKKGTKVKIVLNVKEGLHDWVVDEFNARTKQINEGKSDTVEFMADKAGTFEYYCSVLQHRKMGMVGKLIVE